MQMTTSKDTGLPLPGRPAQWAAGLALVALMALTRGHHMLSVEGLPSASWAVFFLAGMLVRPAWFFPALFLLASGLDFGTAATGMGVDWCLSPAYWALLPAYGSLWFAGRLYARWHVPGAVGWLRLGAVLLGVTFVAYSFSGGGFYLLSGYYDAPSLAGMAERMLHYYPRRLGVLAAYVGIGMGVLMAVRRLLVGHAADGARSA